LSFYARFEKYDDCLLRFDTRVYLNGTPQPQKDGKCVAAVIGKNPGSAKPSNGSEWQALDLDGDKMLPSIRNRFIAAYERANVPIPSLAYVRVLNLFYLCNPTLKEALEATDPPRTCPKCATEQQAYHIAWFAWGGNDAGLNPFKGRFLRLNAERAFFYDWSKREVVPRAPAETDFAKHIQGLRKEPIIEHLANLLKTLA